jgi:hypothetical protein
VSKVTLTPIRGPARFRQSVRGKPVRSLAALTLVIFGATWLACCSSPRHGPAAAYGPPPALEEYRSSLGEYESIAESFDPKGTLLGDEAYRALVAKYREEGLDSLSEAERVSFLYVAETAFLAYAITLRYSVTSDGPVDADGVPVVSATLEEVYRHLEALSEDLSSHLDFPSVAARRVKGSNVSWSWISLPARDPQAPADRREFFEFDPQEGNFVTSMTWDRDGDAWRCATFEGRDDNWGMAHLAYLGRFGSYARGDLEGRDTLDGRPAYRFSIRGDPAWEDQTYWLDAETLWLRQYEYELDGVHYRVKLEAVNEDIHIEPPGVIVECGEGKPPSGTVSG